MHDDLARKLYERRWAGDGEPWDATSAAVRACWEDVAVLSRSEVMANNFAALLNMTEGDAEAAPYRAGVLFMIGIMNGTADKLPEPAVMRTELGKVN